MDFWQTLGKINFGEFEKNKNLNKILKKGRKNMNENGDFFKKDKKHNCFFQIKKTVDPKWVYNCFKGHPTQIISKIAFFAQNRCQ